MRQPLPLAWHWQVPMPVDPPPGRMQSIAPQQSLE